MADTPTDLLVAGYEEIEAATKDFDRLAALLKHRLENGPDE